MSDNLMEKVNAFGEKLKIGGSEVGQKISEGMSSVGFKMREFFQGSSEVDRIVEEATADTLDEPDWATNLELCDMINHDRINSLELIRGVKKRIMMKVPRVQYLGLVLLETISKNCEKAFSEFAAERVLDEMVKIVDDPQTVVNNRNKALILIEAWGESSDELRYLPVYEETYKSLRSRGIRFPGRDGESLAPIFTPPRSTTAPEPNASLAQQMYNEVPVISFSPEETKEVFDVARNSIELLTTVLSSSPEQEALQGDLTITLVQQCHQSQNTVQRIIESAVDDEALLFEALSINDEIQNVISKFEDMKVHIPVVPPVPERAMIPIAAEPADTPLEGKEDALIRKPSGSTGGSKGMNNNEVMDNLDEMLFGKSANGTSGTGHTGNKGSPKDDLISL
ncbi:hypothetical protein DCAR_0310206 [Daucus carota subsp. sativus]|uniref:VHS domain-containing protein n=1 Tax=Daucus carota subsp. sativus TaxID=79200 RepID=A0AAF1APQ9_DAUCS|nr:hypothetical protein DCAR_0310206 [Daucus carota subsp. sativus]